MSSITYSTLRAIMNELHDACRHGDLQHLGLSPTIIDHWSQIRQGDLSFLLVGVYQMIEAIRSELRSEGEILNDYNRYVFAQHDERIYTEMGYALMWRLQSEYSMEVVQKRIRDKKSIILAKYWESETDGLSPLIRALIGKVMELSAHGRLDNGANLIKTILVIGVIMLPDNKIESLRNLGSKALQPTIQSIYHSTCYHTAVAKNDPLVLRWLFKNRILFDSQHTSVVRVSEFWHAGAWGSILKEIQNNIDVDLNACVWVNKIQTIDIIKAAQDAKAATALWVIMRIVRKTFTRREIEDLAPSAEIAAAAIKNLERVVKEPAPVIKKWHHWVPSPEIKIISRWGPDPWLNV